MRYVHTVYAWSESPVAPLQMYMTKQDARDRMHDEQCGMIWKLERAKPARPVEHFSTHAWTDK